MSENSYQWTPRDLAGPGKRYQGQFIDLLISLLIYAICAYVLQAVGAQSVAAQVIVIGIPLSYFVLSDALPNGQSLAKKMLKISVVSKSTGKPCTILQSFMRNAFTPFLGIFDAVLIFGAKRQCLGDKMANTIVIKKS